VDDARPTASYPAPAPGLAGAPDGVAARLAPYLPALARPVGEAEGLPGWIYEDAEVFEAERRRIFAPSWVGVAFESDVPAPGDAMAVDYAGWRFIVARGQDGRVRCFYNLCRHRGMPVMEGARSGARTISCPWHMWTYDLDGALVATPNIGGVNVHDCADFAKDGLGLIPVRADTWLGAIFVNVDGAAPPLAAFLAPLRARLAAFDLDRTEEAEERYDSAFEGNWKIAVEGGVEDYHIPWVHRQLGPSGAFRGEGEGESWVGVTCRRDMDVARRRFVDPDAARGDLPLPLFPHFPETGEAEASVILSTLPATLVAAITDHAVVSLFIPDGPTRTRVRRRFRFVAPAGRDPAYAAARRRTVDAWGLVTEQDGPVIGAVQRLAAMRDTVGFRPRFSPHWEPAVHHFQKAVAGRLAGVALV